MKALTAGWQEQWYLGDLLGNLALFVPYGLFGAMALGRLKATGRWILLGAGAVVLAFGLQIAQLWLPNRVPDLGDGLVNLAGTAIGVAVSRLPWARLPVARLPREPAALLPALLLASWLAYKWFPYIPTLDWYTIKQGLKPLLLEPRLDWLGVLRNAVAWLVFAVLWRECRLREAWLAVVIPFAVLLQVVIAYNAIALDGVIGAVVALAAWPLLRRMEPPYGPAVFGLIALILLQGLAPFEWAPSRFHWVPFHGFLTGSMLVNMLNLLLKFYLYGSMVWLIYLVTRSLRASLVVPVLVTAVVEFGQTRLAGHTAEITDPILCVLVWSVVWVALHADRPRRPAAQ